MSRMSLAASPWEVMLSCTCCSVMLTGSPRIITVLLGEAFLQSSSPGDLLRHLGLLSLLLSSSALSLQLLPSLPLLLLLLRLRLLLLLLPLLLLLSRLLSLLSLV